MLSKSDSKEKRLFMRIPCFWHGNFSNEEQTGYAIFQNFSATGAEIKTYSQLEAGDELDFNVMTKRKRHMSFSGRVSWCRKAGGLSRAGVNFNKLMLLPLKKIM